MSKGLIAVCVKNMVDVVCFTALAIVFEKWWIVLFSMLLMTSYERKFKEEDDERKRTD